MKQNILKHWKTTTAGLITLLVYYLLSKNYIQPPFDIILKENLELILVSVASIVLAVYAKDNDNVKEK